MFTKRLAAVVSVAALGILLFPASNVASALPVPTAWDAFEEYYYNLDNVPHVNPRNYGYLPESYEEPWLYLRPIDHQSYLFDNYPAATKARPLPQGGYYRDGYGTNWYYDYYTPGGRVVRPQIKWYDW